MCFASTTAVVEDLCTGQVRCVCLDQIYRSRQISSDQDQVRLFYPQVKSDQARSICGEVE